jgi:O-antigen/teichoic acid export membrane protein
MPVRRACAGGAAVSEEDQRAASRRVARGTFVRAAGELTAKLASIAFFVILARELGEEGFGDFIFGMSLSTVLLSAAAFGADELLVREVARDRGRLSELYSNIFVIKGAMLVALLGVLALIVLAGDYSAETRLAVEIIGVGVALEVLLKTPFATLQAFEQMKYIAWALVLQRTLLAALGIAILAMGGGLIPVSVAMPVAATVAVAIAIFWLYRYVARPRFSVDRSVWMAIIRGGVPLGFAILMFTLLLKADMALLSFLSGGDNAEVGQYGAAYRLIEATMFISWAFVGAMMPWLSRQDAEGSESLSRGYELGMKALVAMLLPIGAGMVLYAEPLISLIYGSAYDNAVVPLQLLGVTTVLFGINSLGATLMIAQDRPRDFALPAGIVIVQNVALNFILIPPLGATGAAISALVSGFLLAGFTVHLAGRRFGRISVLRVLVAPVLAVAAMAAIAVAGGFELDPPWVVGAVLAYCVTIAVVERAFFPEDFDLFRDAVKRARAGEGDEEAAAVSAAAPVPTELET